MSSSLQSPQAEVPEPEPVFQWPPANPGPMIAHTRISANGRIVIPAAMREKLGLKANDTVMLTLEGGELKLESHKDVIRRIQEHYKGFGDTGVLWSDELIAERREEARRELGEIQGRPSSGTLESV